MEENTYSQQLDDIQKAETELAAKKFRILEKAMKSDNPTDIVKANKVFQQMQYKGDSSSKAFFIDPLQFNANLGYKDKPFSLTYTTLKRMSRVPVINSIIKTRKNQIADFAEPQENRYSTGFIVRKKPKIGESGTVEMDRKDKRIAYAITDFLLKGGSEDTWMADDFDTFIRKIVEDSLIYDQMTFELIRNRRGQLERFVATDAATFRMSDSYYDKDYDNVYFKRNGADVWKNRQDWGRKVNGYYPAYVQVYQNMKVNDFYPWELCFGIRNPSSSIYANGYGCSELEELINVVTSLLWGDEYNRRFFSQGSAPKGLLRIKGVNNEAALQQFKQQWQSMITGVMQAWKTPVVEADVDWIDLQKNNRDMEYSNWMEYLIKLACAVYSIDPSEIGWDISRGEGSRGLFESSQEQRLKHSKDKGLYPLLKFIQRKINRYIVEQINPEFEFQFVGLNGLTIEEELKMDIDKLNAFMTVNEIREKYELKPLEYGEQPNNPTYVSVMQQEKMRQQQEAMQQQYGMQDGGGEEPEGEEPQEEPEPQQEEEEYDEDNPFGFDWGDEESEKGHNSLKDELVKAFDAFLEQEQKRLEQDGN